MGFKLYKIGHVLIISEAGCAGWYIILFSLLWGMFEIFYDKK